MGIRLYEWLLLGAQSTDFTTKKLEIKNYVKQIFLNSPEICRDIARPSTIC